MACWCCQNNYSQFSTLPGENVLSFCKIGVISSARLKTGNEESNEKVPCKMQRYCINSTVAEEKA